MTIITHRLPKARRKMVAGLASIALLVILGYFLFNEGCGSDFNRAFIGAAENRDVGICFGDPEIAINEHKKMSSPNTIYCRPPGGFEMMYWTSHPHPANCVTALAIYAKDATFCDFLSRLNGEPGWGETDSSAVICIRQYALENKDFVACELILGTDYLEKQSAWEDCKSGRASFH